MSSAQGPLCVDELREVLSAQVLGAVWVSVKKLDLGADSWLCRGVAEGALASGAAEDVDELGAKVREGLLESGATSVESFYLRVSPRLEGLRVLDLSLAGSSLWYF